jgi:hypothetical protein
LESTSNAIFTFVNRRPSQRDSVACVGRYEGAEGNLGDKVFQNNNNNNNKSQLFMFSRSLDSRFVSGGASKKENVYKSDPAWCDSNSV